MNILKATILILTVAAGAAQADVKTEIAKIEASERVCINNDSSTAGMKECQYLAYQQYDALLNRTYQSVVAKLKAQIPLDRKMGISDNMSSVEVLRRLQDSSVAWIAYKQKNCSFEGVSMLGGTGEGLVVGGCLNDETKNRTLTIDRLAGEGQIR